MFTPLLSTSAVTVSFDGAGIVEAFVISLGAGTVLWFVVPRGVVLTKSRQDPDGETRVPDTWTITNTSSVAIEVESVEVSTPGGTKRARDELSFADDTLDVRQAEKGSWAATVVPPGESLRAHVPANHTMTIKYRRDGRTGWLERRRLDVHGYV